MPATTRTALRVGIDIGGTAIKYGVVDTTTGLLAGPMAQLPTPDSPAAVAHALQEVAVQIQQRDAAPLPQSPVGVAFPAIIRRGIACSAANISDEWLGQDVNSFLGRAMGLPVHAMNDADAAGWRRRHWVPGRAVTGRCWC
ncbi:hypothetical protein ART_4119 [Arthrobacter sp. PAMC 25486]|nr:hypothetical protein ART_4119 [Arthrobacter sp. PAMC 25486]